MPRFDLDEEELRAYRPDVREPADFESFWKRTLVEARSFNSPAVLREHDSGLRTVDTYALTFPGFGGHPINAWVIVPRHISGPHPAIVEFVGYTGGRGYPHERLQWASAGFAHIIMDTRGQGGNGGLGATADPMGSGPAATGFVTRGIEAPEQYYYRRVFTDAVRAVDATRSLEFVDAGRVVVAGGSQGGGIALAAAGLSDGIAATLSDFPFLCHFERAVAMTDTMPYEEIANYLRVHRDNVEQAFDTLAYFDGVNFAKRAKAPAYFSLGMLDPVCPPSTIYAAVNHYAGEADVEVYPFNRHEGGYPAHFSKQLRWVNRIVGDRGEGSANRGQALNASQ